MKKINILKNNYLYFITPNFNKNIFKLVENVLKAGVRIIQFRDKTLNDKLKYYVGKHLRKLCNEYDALFIVNDRIDITIATDADGVHLGNDDLPVNVARKLLGNDYIIGRTIRNLEEGILAEKLGADYVGAGPVFKTETKKIKHVLDIKELKEIVSSIRLPVFAIGGINKSNVHKVLESNVHGVAVISAIASSDDPYREAKTLLTLINKYKKKHTKI